MACSLDGLAPSVRDAICKLLAQASSLRELRLASQDWRLRVQPILVDELIARLTRRGRACRRAAVHALGHVAKRGCPAVIAAVASRLADERDAVRLAAVGALPRLVERGDREVISAMALLFESHDARLREAALDALAGIAKKGDKDVVAGALAQLSDSEPRVRMAAVRTAAEIADRGDPSVVSVVTSRLEGSDSSLQQAALSSLPGVLEKADKRVVASVAARLQEEENWQLRQTAVSTLAELARPGDQTVMGVIAERLEDPDWPVRGAALDALAKLAKPGDEGVVSHLLSCLEDCTPYVRCAAAERLVHVAKAGDLEVISTLAARIKGSHLQHNECHPMVRRAIAGALEQMGVGDAEALLQTSVDGAGARGPPPPSTSSAPPSLEALERWAAAEVPGAAGEVPGGAEPGAAPEPGADGAAPPPGPAEGALAAGASPPRCSPAPAVAAPAAPAPAVARVAPTLRREQEGARRPSPAWLPVGSRCGVCSKKVADECGGVVCRRVTADDGETPVGCGEGACWRCMKRAPVASFGGVRTTKEEFESWGEGAWWMHEGCMRDEDWREYVGEGGGEQAEAAQEEPSAVDGASAEQAPASAPPKEREKDVDKMSVRQLKEILASRQVDCADCIEKADLVRRVLKALEEGSAKDLELD